MSGELLVTRDAVRWLTLSLVPAAGAGAAIAGARGAISTSIAIGLVVANALAAAAISTLAGKRWRFGAPMIAFPSFTFRMTAVVSLLVVITDRPFIDTTIFACTFGVAIFGALVLEARTFKRTPWLALTFGPKEQL
ncbi:MAG: hypothetical protein ABR552_08890 [Actinomycetota bacterium]